MSCVGIKGKYRARINTMGIIVARRCNLQGNYGPGGANKASVCLCAILLYLVEVVNTPTPLGSLEGSTRAQPRPLRLRIRRKEYTHQRGLVAVSLCVMGI